MSLISGISLTSPGREAHTVAGSHPMQLAALGTSERSLAVASVPLPGPAFEAAAKCHAGTYRFELSCWWHKATWTKDVTVPETAALVREFADQALAAEQAGAVVPASRRSASDSTFQA